MDAYKASKIENAGLEVISGIAGLGAAALGWYLGQKYGGDIAFVIGPLGVLLGGGVTYAALKIPLQGLVCSRDLERARECMEEEDFSNVEILAMSAKRGSETVSQQADTILKELAARAA